MRTPDPQKTAKPSAVDGADFTGGPSLLMVLERIACALERQNELLEVQNDAIVGVSNRIEDAAGYLS